MEMFTLLVKFPVAVAMDSRGSPFPNSVDSPGDIFVPGLSHVSVYSVHVLIYFGQIFMNCFG